MFFTAEDLPAAPMVPFFDELNKVLDAAGLDDFVAGLCARYYHDSLGRPSLPPAVYFRMHLLGFLMVPASERSNALRAVDSLSLRKFLGYALNERTPDHSTLSKTRRRLPLEVHERVAKWVVALLREAGLAQGKQVAVDVTALQANAALKGVCRKDGGARCDEYVQAQAAAEGEDLQSREDLVRYDRKRKGKKLSNAEWESASDPDARVAKMKNGVLTNSARSPRETRR